MGRLAGKVALVTGAAKGIGEAVALIYLREGASVLLTDVDESRWPAIAAEFPDAAFKYADVTDEQNISDSVDYAVARFGALDIMVNNAGLIGAAGPVAELDTNDWHRTFAILLDGVFFGTKHAARVMMPRKTGRILTTASVAGLASGLGAHAYTAAKHGVIGFVKSTAVELSVHGICTNVVAPGSTVTPLAVKFTGSVEQATELCARDSLLGRAVGADDIAEAFLYLAAESGRNVTGQTIVVDGGVLAGANLSGKVFYGPDRGFLG